MADASNDDDFAEEILWRCDEAYIYQIPKSRSSHGYRADEWNVDKWLKAVKVKIIARGDHAQILLLDQETEELFASVPVPIDQPLSTAVEPVIDSSRYYVVKVVDEGRRLSLEKKMSQNSN